jgi:hypothetical protein
MVLGLVLGTVAMIAWAISYSVGQLVHDKLSLLRAADAAVLSAAMAQARALNTHAYLNRAQLGHQVAMAHLVTLASHENFRVTQARQVSRQNPPAFLIGMFFGPAYAAAYLSARMGGIDDALALSRLEQAFRKHDDLIHSAIEHVRRQLLRDLPHARNRMFEKILIRNVGASGSAMRGATLKQLGLSYEIRQDDMVGRVHYLSHQSPVWQSALSNVMKPYGYLHARNHTAHNQWAINTHCPHKRHELRRLGHTSLSADGAYEASDSLSFHAIRSNKIIGCYQREYPMGWAVVTAKNTQIAEPDSGQNSSMNFSRQSFWKWVRDQSKADWDIFNGSDNQLGKQWARSSRVRWTMKKVPRYADITDHPDIPIPFEVNIHQSAKSLGMLNAQSKVKIGEKLNFSLLGTNDSIRAHSAAESYFERPGPRNDRQQETPSLFHPYWHARLINAKSVTNRFIPGQSYVSTAIGSEHDHDTMQ